MNVTTVLPRDDLFDDNTHRFCLVNLLGFKNETLSTYGKFVLIHEEALCLLT